MIQNFTKVLQICRELLPELNDSTAVTTKINLDLDFVVGQIYQSYFASVLSTSKSIGNNIQHNLTNHNEIILPSGDDVWIFGYGSLVWKADFPFIDRRRGFIRGYQRRFFQSSIDHRGTHQKPGRVVTLLPTGQLEDRVYGVAYRIAAQQKVEVLAHLDYREKNGYERCTLEFQEFPEETGLHFDIIMYIATPMNTSYAGAVSQLDNIAEQIFTSAGPSGTNCEYLFNLANAMRELFPGVEDKHLFDLETAVSQRVKKNEMHFLERAIKREIQKILSKAAEVIDDEQIEKGLILRELKQLSSKCSDLDWREKLLTQELSAGSL